MKKTIEVSQLFVKRNWHKLQQQNRESWINANQIIGYKNNIDYKQNNQIIKTMDAKEKVLATMKEAGQPLNAGKIAELSGLDRKEVDAAMKQLKAEGAIVSPVRCKWAPAE
mgnify:CR=1 FL=1